MAVVFFALLGCVSLVFLFSFFFFLFVVLACSWLGRVSGSFLYRPVFAFLLHFFDREFPGLAWCGVVPGLA